MSVLSVVQTSPDEPQMRPKAPGSDLDAVKSQGWWDSTKAATAVAVDEVPFMQDVRLQSAYAPVLAAMADATGKSRFFAYQSILKMVNPLGGPDNTDYDALWDDINRLSKLGKLPAGVPTDRATFENRALTRDGQRQRDMIVAGQGSASSRLIGGLAAGFTDPYMTGLAIATGGAGAELSAGRAILADGLANAGIAAVETPATMNARARLGEQTSAGDVAQNVGTAFLFGAAAGGMARAIGAGWRAGKSAIGNPEARSPVEIAKAFAKAVPEQLRTPDQAAALAVIDRDADLAAKNPFEPGSAGEDAHFSLVDAAQRRIVDPAAPGPRMVTPQRLAQGGAVDSYLAAVRKSESGGNPNARNPMPGQTASGLYGFTNQTWIGTYRAAFPKTGLSDGAILALKGDAALQESLMRRLTEDNAARLQRIGAEVDPANLYIMHHLGTGDGPKVLRAAPDTPLSSLLSEKIIDVNPYMKGMTVGDFVSWARERMGQERGTIDAPAAIGAGDDQMLAALETERAQVEAERMAAQRDLSEDAQPARDSSQPAGTEIPVLRTDHFASHEEWRMAQAQMESELGAAPGNADLPPIQRVEANVAQETAADDSIGPAAMLGFVPQKGPPGISVITEDGAIATAVFRDENGIARGAVQMPISDAGRENFPEVSTYVRPEYRRQGVATKLYDALQKAGYDVDALSGTGDVTPNGAAFINSRRMNKAAAVAQAGKVRAEAVNSRGSMPVTVKDAPVAPMPEAIVQRYVDPAAAETKAQADSFTHDVQAAQDMGQYTGIEFGLDAGSRETPQRALNRLDDDDAALAALRSCL